MPNAKKQFNDILKLTRSDISYRSISQKVDEILAKEEPERTRQLEAYHAQLLRDVFKSGTMFRISEENKPTSAGKATNFNLIHGRTLSKRIGDALGQMMVEKKPELSERNMEISQTAEQVRDMLVEVGRDLNALDGLKRNGREQDIKLLNMTADNTFRNTNRRDDPKFDPTSTDTYHTTIAEMYIIYKERKAVYDKMMQRNFLWRFLNRGEIKKTQHYLNVSAEILAKTDFDAKVHGPMVEARFAAEPYSFLKGQIDAAKDDVKAEKAAIEAKEKIKNTVQLTVARDKEKLADELNEKVETSIVTKWGPYIEKYNIPIGAKGVNTQYSGFKNSARAFDTQRDISSFKTTMQQRFLNIYGCMITGALNKNGTVDAKDILKDAQEMLNIELHHRTIVYEHPEAKPLADQNVYAGVSDAVLKKRMADAIATYNKTAAAPISQEKIDELQSSIETILKTDREANERRLAEAAPKSNESVEVAENGKASDIVKNENDVARQSIAINLPSENDSSEKAPMVQEDPTLAKEAVQKSN